MDDLKDCTVAVYCAQLHINGFMEPITITNRT